MIDQVTAFNGLSYGKYLGGDLEPSLRLCSFANAWIRVIALLQHLHLLIPIVRSSAIRPEGEAQRTQRDAIEEELVRDEGK